MLAATIDTPAVLTKEAVVTLTFELRSRNIDKDMTHIILHQIPECHKYSPKRLGGVREHTHRHTHRHTHTQTHRGVTGFNNIDSIAWLCNVDVKI